MSLEHQGIVKNGKEDKQNQEVKKWKGIMENYTLKGIEGKAHLAVEVDIDGKYMDDMQKALPKSL